MRTVLMSNYQIFIRVALRLELHISRRGPAPPLPPTWTKIATLHFPPSRDVAVVRCYTMCVRLELCTQNIVKTNGGLYSEAVECCIIGFVKTSIIQPDYTAYGSVYQLATPMDIGDLISCDDSVRLLDAILESMDYNKLYNVNKLHNKIQNGRCGTHLHIPKAA